jgi:hypothetical protein
LPLDGSNATQRQKLSKRGSHVAAQSPSPQTRAGLRVEARRLLYTFDLTVVSVHVKAKELKSLSGSKGPRHKVRIDYVFHVKPLDAAHFNPQELAALPLAAAVQAGPSVPDAIFDSAREYLSDRQLVELIGL